MSDARTWLAEAQERASKATDGPWEADGDGWIGGKGCFVVRADYFDDGSKCPPVLYEGDGDAEFIAAARTEHPAMAAALAAVLKKADAIEAEGKGKSVEMFARAVADEFRATIEKHLPKEDA